jgi:hypothetical protein
MCEGAGLYHTGPPHPEPRPPDYKYEIHYENGRIKPNT